MHLHRLSLIGVGLLGGSIGLAVRAKINGVHITGYGHRRATLDAALEVGAIDEAVDTLGKAAEGADLVVLCTPVGLFGDMLRGISQTLKPGAVVTDVGSTKRSVTRLAAELLSRDVGFVGSHPMAGSEKRGVEFARTDLFDNALCILTPTGQTRAADVSAVEGFWKGIGMRTCRMSPEEHDAALAEVSHLPHALAAALVAVQSPAALKLAGKGFLDTTRIAGGDGGLWRDIFLDNADNVRAALARLRGALEDFERLVAEPGGERGEGLRTWLDAAARRRDALLREKLKEIAGE